MSVEHFLNQNKTSKNFKKLKGKKNEWKKLFQEKLFLLYQSFFIDKTLLSTFLLLYHSAPDQVFLKLHKIHFTDHYFAFIPQKFPSQQNE